MTQLSANCLPMRALLGNSTISREACVYPYTGFLLGGVGEDCDGMRLILRCICKPLLT